MFQFAVYTASSRFQPPKLQMSDNDEAETSMARTIGLSKAEHDLAEAVTKSLNGKGPKRLYVWCRSTPTNALELQIPGVGNGRTIMEFQPDTFVEANIAELTDMIFQKLRRT